jgi:uncharacterized cupredoxin-like copper-binding protein
MSYTELMPLILLRRPPMILRRNRPPLVVAALAAFGAALVITACAPADDGGSAAQEVEVGLTEFEIDMPASVAAGDVTFNISNMGTFPHNFEIEGEGVEEVLPEDLAPGESGTLEVTLEPGTYTIYCPVEGHRGEGMETELEVTDG